MNHWRPAHIPSLTGQLAIVTGSNSGVGRSTARELARAGATVILACRDTTKAQTAKHGILAAAPGATVEVASLNLADLASVRGFAAQFLAGGVALDLLVNNAGVMMPPKRQTTVDGFELQLGTNHLGHFALTGLLMPAILRAPGARVVTVASLAHKGATIHFDDLQAERKYRPMARYGQSKLANLLFGFELQRRFERAGAHAASLVVHPGISATSLVPNGLGTGLLGSIMDVGFKVVGQSEDRGAFPTLYAATAPTAEGGRYYGPDGLLEYRGFPVEVRAEPQASDPRLAAKLWTISEQLTGVRYEALRPGVATAHGDFQSAGWTGAR